jgi:hypothetical protein
MQRWRQADRIIVIHCGQELEQAAYEKSVRDEKAWGLWLMQSDVTFVIDASAST